MPRIKVECFCKETNPDGDDASWTSIVACGHLYHTVCINKWIWLSPAKSRPLCPICRARIDGRDPPPKKPPPKKPPPTNPPFKQLVRLFLEAELASEGASQMPKEKDDDPIDDSSEDEDLSPVEKLAVENQKLQKRIVKLTGEMRTLAFSKKDLVKEVETLEEDAEDHETVVAELQETIDELEDQLQTAEVELAEAQEELEAKDDELADWEQGQPAVKQELAEVQAELAALTQAFTWNVEDSTKREELHQEIQEELLVEMKERALDRTQFEGRIRKLEERVKLEGSPGRERIKELEKEVDRLTQQLSTDRIEYDDRYEILASKMGVMETAHSAQTARDAARMAANSRRVEDAQTKQASAADEILRLQSGNSAWKFKYDKLNDKFKALQNRAAPVVHDSPESSPLRVEGRPSKTASPSPPLPAFKIKNTASLLVPSRQTEFDIELEDDELESYRDRDEADEEGDLLDQYSPRKKQRTDGMMTTLIDRDASTSFGVKKGSLSKTTSDQHIPNLFLSTGNLDAGRKIKGKQGFSR